MSAPTPSDSPASMICAQFIFKPGIYDDDFHRLDGEIDAFARSLPGFDHAETWHAAEGGLVNAIYYFTDRRALAQLARFRSIVRPRARYIAGTTATASSSAR